MATTLPEDVDGIQAYLDAHLEVEFSFIKTAAVSAQIAALCRADREFILIWVRRLASTNIQIAFQFISRAIETLSQVDKSVLQEWALFAMDQYDQLGLRAGLKVIEDIDTFIGHSRQRAFGAIYQDHEAVLLHFAHGLAGRQLSLAQADVAWTDTETIYLPSVVTVLVNRLDNFRVYKCMLAFQWAQICFGTFQLPWKKLLLQGELSDELCLFFFALETARLEMCIARELPGLYRDLQNFEKRLSSEPAEVAWQALCQQVKTAGTTAEQVLKLARANYQSLSPPPARFFQGELLLEDALATMSERIAREKAKFRLSLAKMLEDQLARSEQTPRFSKKLISREGEVANKTMELTLDDKPVMLPEPTRELMTSIMLDLGDIPDEYLVPAGAGEYDPSLFQDSEPDPEDVWKGTYHEEGAYLYDEWDFQRQHYHKNWCAVREHSVTPVYDDFVSVTLQKYSGLVKQLRRTFEAMRDEDRLLKRQVQGDDVDIDGLVEALADASDGSEMSDRVYTHMHRAERNVAVCFMVDMSGSTKGWINDAEREALVLMAETLETLGDRYAIYGFSGMARKRCEIYKVKAFDEVYDEEIKARISGIEPKDYTRMGFAIRHLSGILNQVDAKTRILITLSDGKPDDYDSYRGDYGIEDTRRALIEARHTGIYPYCITIDHDARDYLPHMYGIAAYTVLDEVRKLPLKVSDIYRRLTT